MYIESGWEGEVELNGQKWILSLVDDLDGRIIVGGSSGTATPRDVFVLKKPRQEESEKEVSYSYESDELPVSRHLFRCRDRILGMVQKAISKGDSYRYRSRSFPEEI